MKVKGRNILITGAGSGIGKALTLRLLQMGANVVALDRQETSLQELHKEVKQNPQLKIYTCDVSEEAAVQQLRTVFPDIDILINNAGIIQPFVKVQDLKWPDIHHVMQVNFFATLHLTKVFLPGMLSRNSGHIVNISSMGGFLPVPGQTIYGASKAAVKLFTEGLWSELKGTGVNVTVVFPGAVATNITTNSGIQIPEQMKSQQSDYKSLPAEKAARIIIEGIEDDAFRVLVGSDASFMDKLYRFHPRFATAYIYKQMRFLLEQLK